MHYSYRIVRDETTPEGAQRTSSVLADVDKALKEAEAAGLHLTARIDEDESSDEAIVVHVSAPDGSDGRAVSRTLSHAFAHAYLHADIR